MSEQENVATVRAGMEAINAGRIAEAAPNLIAPRFVRTI
jgi:predicted transcriptional regulator